MKIIIDDKIPYIKGAFEPFAEVVYLPGSQTTAEIVRDADALVTRTRTKCDKELLQGSRVRFIATATIGFDHIDTEYCRQAGIEWENAPGCNAESVNQYISSALFLYSMKKKLDLEGRAIGIIGVGQVGSRVARTCEILGMKVLLNDPPRERKEGPAKFVSLEEIQEEADVISFHVPLNMEGEDATFHMANRDFLQGLKRHPLMINSCRGEVFNSEDISASLEAGEISGVIIDCWENEPRLNPGLLKKAEYGTPHIAGYSKDGKANCTKMSVQAISRFFNLGIDDWQPAEIEQPEKSEIEIDGTGRDEYSILAEAVLSTYDIATDSARLKNSPHLFEKLRGDYPVRREFNYYSIRVRNNGTDIIEKLRKLNFNIRS